MSDEPGYIPFVYGRRQNKPLRSRPQWLMAHTLPAVRLPTADGLPIDPRAAFPEASEIWLEVGFGDGEHLVHHAVQRPDIGLIGVEPFLNGVAKLLARIEELGLRNIRIVNGDARPVIEALPAAAISRLFVLHPDPWPKRRHHKRRMISPWFFAEAARVLIPGGALRVSTDVPDYAAWTLMHWQGAAGAFDWTARRAEDWRAPPADWPVTRYGAKALREGRPPVYLEFRRR